jgi:adenylylsulfate kinase
VHEREAPHGRRFFFTAMSHQQDGIVIWFTGVSGSGKTTLATRLANQLSAERPARLLDGDAVRAFFESDLGYSRADRIANVKRLAFGASLLAEQGVAVVVANIAPYREVRDFVRRHVPRYVQIFLDASMHALVERDDKGLYRRRRAGVESQVVGVDEEYERPRHADLTIHTDQLSVDESLKQVLVLLRSKGCAGV